MYMGRVKNPYFRFKSFTVHQSNSAMKVSTDATLFGIYTAKDFKQKSYKNILDIGTGTGLLSLIWAQECQPLHIDAIEINEKAALDAQQNVEQSPFNDCIQVYPLALQDFYPVYIYDVIISNPPFFLNALKNDNLSKSIARHADVGLSPEELMSFAQMHLKAQGSLITLYPSDLNDILIHTARQRQLYLYKKIDVQSYMRSTPHCSMYYWSKEATSMVETHQLVIYAAPQQYTPEVLELTRDYYLHH